MLIFGIPMILGKKCKDNSLPKILIMETPGKIN